MMASLELLPKLGQASFMASLTKGLLNCLIPPIIEIICFSYCTQNSSADPMNCASVTNSPKLPFSSADNTEALAMLVASTPWQVQLHQKPFPVLRKGFCCEPQACTQKHKCLGWCGVWWCGLGECKLLFACCRHAYTGKQSTQAHMQRLTS